MKVRPMSRRTIGAAVLSFAVAALLVTEGLSWAKSARLNLIAATTLSCSVRLDAPGESERAAGLRSGDLLLLPQMDVSARVAGVFHYTPTQAARAGEVIRVAIQRGKQRLSLLYTLRHTDSIGTFIAQMTFKLFLVALASLLLWRGVGRSSIILGLWCMAVGVGLPDAWWGALSVDGRVAGGLLTALLWTGSPLLLYLVVESIAVGVSRRTVIITRLAMVLMIVPALIVNVVDAVAQAQTGCVLIPVTPWLANAAFVANQLVIIVFFALSYAHTSGLAKQRVRWVFWAFLFSRAGVLLNLLNRLAVHPIHLSGFEWATVLIFPIGCAYAILRHRIIDVNFVLNRTLVYTVLTTFVVGVFILLENLLHAAAASRGTGIVVELCVALGLGFSFNSIHKRVEGAIERALFRAKHEAAKTLRRLAEEAPFTESADALLARAAAEVRVAAGAASVGIYERVDDCYRLTVSSGSEPPPKTVDIDDLAFVRLRKNRGCVELADVASALGANGIVFAFAIRGLLTGALVCLRRPSDEAYAPDEAALLGNVAHEVGAELHAIRTRERSELLDALIAGDVNLSDARARVSPQPSGGGLA